MSKWLITLSLGVLFVWAPAICAKAVSVFTNRVTGEAEFLNALSGNHSLVDFDTSPLGPITGDEFIDQGFSFRSLVFYPTNQLFIIPANQFGLSSYLSVNPPGGAAANQDAIQVDVIGDWYAAAFSIYTPAGVISGIQDINFYGDSDNVIYSHSITDGPIWFMGIIADEPIRHFTINKQFHDAPGGFDNFHLGNPVPIPEPRASILLVGVIAFLSLVRWRTR